MAASSKSSLPARVFVPVTRLRGLVSGSLLVRMPLLAVEVRAECRKPLGGGLHRNASQSGLAGERSSNVGRRRKQISRFQTSDFTVARVTVRNQREGDGSGDLKGLHSFLAPAASLGQPCCRPGHGKHPILSSRKMRVAGHHSSTPNESARKVWLRQRVSARPSNPRAVRRSGEGAGSCCWTGRAEKLTWQLASVTHQTLCDVAS